MQFLTVRAIFMFLLAACCLTVASARITDRESSQPTPSREQYGVPLLLVDGKKGFVPIGGACGNGFIHLYESLDGVSICHSIGRLTKRVQQELRTIIKEAIVIEREPRQDEAGRDIGERVILVYERKDTGRQAAIIYSTSWDGISMISGDSLEHVLNFENRNKK